MSLSPQNRLRGKREMLICFWDCFVLDDTEDALEVAWAWCCAAVSRDSTRDLLQCLGSFQVLETLQLGKSTLCYPSRGQASWADCPGPATSVTLSSSRAQCIWDPVRAAVVQDYKVGQIWKWG